MKFNKLIFIITCVGSFFISSEFVYAQNIQFMENNNGLIVSKKEYDFINEYYGMGYFDNMNFDDYEWIKSFNIDDSDVEINTIYSNTLSRNVTYETASKKLMIVKSCSSNCIIVVKCQWLVNPKIRSYDVIGARFSGTDLVSDSIVTKVTSNSGTEYFSNLKRTSNGIGVSVQLPIANNLSIEQKFTVGSSGIVYASYQHAIENVLLATSKLYTINSQGFGGVFQFYGGAVGKYDEMNGVYIDL